METLALCVCGVDLTVHDNLGHVFEAAGTRHRCERFVNGYLCPRPKYHAENGVECGPLTGDLLW